jgi:hypothetical protein
MELLVACTVELASSALEVVELKPVMYNCVPTSNGYCGDLNLSGKSIVISGISGVWKRGGGATQ